MTFKKHGKDNISVVALGTAFAVVSTVMGILNGALVAYSNRILTAYFKAMASVQFLENVLIALVIGFVAGSLLALVYNAIVKTKFASKY